MDEMASKSPMEERRLPNLTSTCPARLSSRNKCQQCAARASALCSGISEDAAKALERITHRIRVPEGRIVFGEFPRAKSFAIIISGVVKLLNAKPDGRHQIVGLKFASDFVGRPYADNSSLIAEAATDLDLCCFSGRVFEDLLAEHHDLESALLKQVLRDLDSARDWMFLLGRKSAQERVAHFLLMISERMSQEKADICGAPKPVRLRLPLSRTEIAESLGLRIETVSRQFTSLKSQGVIVPGSRRTLEIMDIERLRTLSNQAAD